jgi:hypothetical protein
VRVWLGCGWKVNASWGSSAAMGDDAILGGHHVRGVLSGGGSVLAEPTPPLEVADAHHVPRVLHRIASWVEEFPGATQSGLQVDKVRLRLLVLGHTAMKLAVSAISHCHCHPFNTSTGHATSGCG